jgi:hypothetical protein
MGGAIMLKPRNKNLFKDPNDPEYDDNYNYDEELYRYEMEIEMEEDDRRCREREGKV